MRRCPRRVEALVGLVALLVSGSAFAADAVRGEVLVSGLKRPVSIAVQPSTADVFIIEAGARRIVRCKLEFTDSARPQNITPVPVIEKFGGAGAMADDGPYALEFLNRETLVVLVSEGGKPGIRFYDVPTGKNALDARKANHAAHISDAKRAYGLAATPSSVFVASGPDVDPGVIHKSDLRDGEVPGDPAVFVDASKHPGIVAPAGLAISPRGELVAVCSGKQGGKDSSLAFFNAVSGQMLMNLPTGQPDLAALAYSPKTGRLYALDRSAATAGGGLYRLDSALVDGGVGVNAVQLASLDQPTALAFWPDGTLYATALGKDAAAAGGHLLRFVGL